MWLLNRFAAEAIGVPSLSPPPLSLPRLLEETRPEQPVLFLTSPGADPSRELEDFAAERGKQGVPTEIRAIAMGGGQNQDAIELLREGMAKGYWVCLKNLHLVTPWLPALEKELKGSSSGSSSKATAVHSNFRCWLSTESHPKFPSILLESSLKYGCWLVSLMKVTYEAPPGIKKNLLRTLEGWTPAYFGTCPIAERASLRCQLLTLCAHFHAVMQERRSYNPQGWSKFYEFSSSDLASACETVSSLLMRTESSPQKGGGVLAVLDWQSIRGILESAVYGSRVDNDFDLLRVQEYLHLFFNSGILEGRRSDLSTILQIPLFDLPRSSQLGDYRVQAESLDDLDPPHRLGLPANIDRAMQRVRGEEVIASLNLISAAAHTRPGTGGSLQHQLDLKLWAQRLSPLIRLWETQAQQLSQLQQKQQQQASNSSTTNAAAADLSPVETFFHSDAEHASALVAKVTASLSNIAKVIAGTLTVSPVIQQEAEQFLRSEIPRHWLEDWPTAPDTPVAYLTGLASRTSKLRNHYLTLVQKRTGAVLDAPVRLRELLQPDVFLNALRQQTARALGVPLDSLRLNSNFTGNLTQAAAAAAVDKGLSVEIEGLLVEGCQYNQRSGRLEQNDRTSAQLSPLPPLTLSWRPDTERTSSQSGASASGNSTGDPVGQASLPLYTAITREHLICTLELPTDNRQLRILNGCAVFISDTE